MQIFIDGKFYDENNAKISVFDHGLLYGDGVFEGIRSYKGLIFRLEEHIDRLYESAHTIMLCSPYSKEEMTEKTIETLKRNKLLDAYIRILITRGTGDLGLDPKKCPRPTVIIITDSIALYPEEFYKKGMEIITVPTVRNHPEALNPQIKSMNYLNNIMAKIEASNAGCQEALMLNAQGYVTECTGDNIFIVTKQGELVTPPAYAGTLKGITRGAIMDMAKKMEVPCSERMMTRHNIFNAAECFLTGSAAEIMPIVKLDSRQINDGKPGSLTLKLLEAYRQLAMTDGVRYQV
jgi:branched-chain amino acid aminotransferase